MNAFLFAAVFCIAAVPALCATTPRKNVCTDHGELSDRLKKYFQVQDRDSDGRIVGTEQYQTYLNIDANKDGCISQAEFVYRFLAYYRFSSEYAVVVWEELIEGHAVGEKCLLRYMKYYNDNEVVDTVEDLSQRRIQQLINFCEADRARHWHNCDCAQLPDTCTNDPQLKNIPACIEYTDLINNN